MTKKTPPTYRVLYDCPEFQYVFYSGPKHDKAVEALRIAQILATGNQGDWAAFELTHKATDVDALIRMANVVTKVQNTFAKNERAIPCGFTGWLHYSNANGLGYIRYRNGVSLSIDS